ncbi:hypothetical protein BMR1_03g03830 [Babesia microti strain RI]|uniref:Uncharacterized protein n=1 Tax=Babesia microti (strain RI) TaxID=1133968 RepID=A0A1R4AC99_BABMR|nr:hypothetical protein BMR1_03g03830 [Babesia microti strain RI]SJK86610.1 hypothetical protein BMR1_03g03830 [Babesia microti strain RI]|eukprot:XP_021338747.1 hypothetical protein BMR1_03g03830 [Babesia microti strain RI]
MRDDTVPLVAEKLPIISLTWDELKSVLSWNNIYNNIIQGDSNYFYYVSALTFITLYIVLYIYYKRESYILHYYLLDFSHLNLPRKKCVLTYRQYKEKII